MGLNIDYEAIANYIIIIGAIIIFVTIIKSILPILTYNELKKQRKLLEQKNMNIKKNIFEHLISLFKQFTNKRTFLIFFLIII